jgi:hypothetical protein
MAHRPTRRNLIKSGAALGLSAAGWLAGMMPELQQVRAAGLPKPKAKATTLTGHDLLNAVQRALNNPNAAAVAAKLTELGFHRNNADEAVAIQANGIDDQLVYVEYVNATGVRAQLVDLRSNPEAGGALVLESEASGLRTMTAYQRVGGSVVITGVGRADRVSATVTDYRTGTTRTMPVSQPAALPNQAGAAPGVVRADASWCFGCCCSGCSYAEGHWCSISCGFVGTFFCAILCGFWCGIVCGLAWVFICEYGWSCNNLSCCVIGACCCA